jgi:hypothetical protein
MSSSDEQLSVSEGGAYHSLTPGPLTDTEAFASGEGAGVPDCELDTPTLDKNDTYSTGEWPTIKLNANARSNVPEPVSESGRMLMYVGGGLVLTMVLGALLGVAVSSFMGPAAAPEVPAASDDAVGSPEATKGKKADRIPVRDGLGR